MAEGLVLTRQSTERGVHEWAQRAGGASSSGVVREYVGYEEWARGGFLRREVARCGVALILGFGDPMEVFDREAEGEPRGLRAFVVGNQTHSSMTGVAGHQLGVQVELTAPGALALLGDVAAFNDTVVPLDEVLGAAGRRLLEQLADAPSWEERLARLDVSLAGIDLPAFSPEVIWLRRQLEASKGQARVEPLMDETGRSRRFVTDAFRRQYGVPPKTYARVLRFEHATSLLLERAGDRTMADVAMAAGYYDQSHLTREFAALAGMTPGTYAADAEVGPEVRFVQDAAAAPSS
jgi:AraC-like DNA-binding protein